MMTKRRTVRARPADGPNDQALRPDKGRNYAERGGAHPVARFTWHFGCFIYRFVHVASGHPFSLISLVHD
jgi:hypothetical protein